MLPTRDDINTGTTLPMLSNEDLFTNIKTFTRQDVNNTKKWEIICILERVFNSYTMIQEKLNIEYTLFYFNMLNIEKILRDIQIDNVVCYYCETSQYICVNNSYYAIDKIINNDLLILRELFRSEAIKRTRGQWDANPIHPF